METKRMVGKKVRGAILLALSVGLIVLLDYQAIFCLGTSGLTDGVHIATWFREVLVRWNWLVFISLAPLVLFLMIQYIWGKVLKTRRGKLLLLTILISLCIGLVAVIDYLSIIGIADATFTLTEKVGLEYYWRAKLWTRSTLLLEWKWFAFISLLPTVFLLGFRRLILLLQKIWRRLIE